MYNYLRYSGIAIIFHLNPLHWKILPWFRDEKTVEAWSTDTFAIGFLFLTIRVWIDNGEW